MARKMTKKTWEVYKFIIDFVREYPGQFPTYRDIIDECAHKSTSSVAYALETIAEQGLIERKKVGRTEKWVLCHAVVVLNPPHLV